MTPSQHTKGLRILVTNDDGIHAPGLKVLERIARSLSRDVWVVAPEVEQSGAGHSLTLHTPLRVRKVTPRRFAVSGTPTDCVLLAARSLIPRNRKKIDLVLSGINRGCNVADDVTYSGTIAAAMEGALLEIPSIAVSQAIHDDAPVHWQTAERHVPPLIAKLLAAGWERQTLININTPHCAADAVKGVAFAAQGQRKIGEKIHLRHDPKKRPYYWIGGDIEEKEPMPGTDFTLLAAGYVTVTPLSLDLTDYKQLERLREAAG